MRCQPVWCHPANPWPSWRLEQNYAADLWWPTEAAPSQSLREASELHCADEPAKNCSLRSVAQVLLAGPVENTSSN
jgi:hypothetical protein